MSVEMIHAKFMKAALENPQANAGYGLLCLSGLRLHRHE